MATLYIIVGVSKGFGKAILKVCMESIGWRKNTGQFGFLLLTSCKAKCMKTWNDVYSEVIDEKYDTNGRIRLVIDETDLSKPNCYRQRLELILSEFQFRINRYFIFFNAGSVTPVGPMLQETANFHLQLENHCNLNFVSFVSTVRNMLLLILQNENIIIRLVNVSSLAAVKSLHGMSVYGAVKAAREGIIFGLAAELMQKYPQLDAKLLNYCPGPMKTDMVVHDLMGEFSANNFVKEHLTSFVNCEESARKCLSLLTTSSSNWKSGDRIDFYDNVS